MNAAGVSPSQAPIEAILKVDLYGTAVLLEEVGKVIAEGGAGVTISSQSGWRMPQLTPEQDRQLAMTPTEELLSLEILKPENIRDTLHAYQLAKRCNEKRVMYECVRWGERGARLNDIAPGIIVTPLAIDEFNGPRGDFYKNMFAKCPAGRPGTADEMANIAELLISMTVLLPLLMAYSLIGEKFHEIAGTAIFVLFIIHHILNRKWNGALFKRKYNARRVFQTVLDMLLLIFMILQPVSGILMSKHLYTFLPALPISAWARSAHMLLAYWGYILLSIHAGTHLIAPLRKLYRKNKKIFVTICVSLGCVSAYGCAAFIRRGFPGYMFGKTAFAFFDYSEPRMFFFMDYIAIMILFMAAGCLIMYGFGRIDTKRKAVRK